VKLVVAVLANPQADEVVEVLLEKGQRVTRLATTGAFLRQGNTTLIVGVDEEAVADVLATVEQRAPRAMVLVLPLERYEHF
jgi:uncharacterized protein YaaQ